MSARSLMARPDTMPTEADMFPNNYGHTGSDDG